MHLDVLDLRNFYYRTGLGRAVQKAVREEVVQFWPDAKGMTFAGYGFAAPLMRPYLASAERVVALMPGPQGVMHWPAGQPNVSVLCEEALWPLQTGQVDRLLVLHGLETSEMPSRVLDECARVLSAQGRALFVVPNRRGIWARRDKTPFGYGRPYSIGQLEAQVRQHGFVLERHKGALFQLPSDRKFWLKMGPFIERQGRRFSSGIGGGVLLAEASKEVFLRPKGTPATARRPMRILEGIAKPV